MQELRKRLELQITEPRCSQHSERPGNKFISPPGARQRSPPVEPWVWLLAPSQPLWGPNLCCQGGWHWQRWPGRRGDAPRAPGEAPCPPQVGLAGGTVSAISELLIGFTATALTTPLLALTSCLNHHSNSSERCDLLFKTHSAALFDPLARCAAGRAGGAVGARLGEHSPRTRGFRDTQGHSGEGGGKETSPSCSR